MFIRLSGLICVALIVAFASQSCGHRRQLPPGMQRQPPEVAIMVEKKKTLNGYDSLRQCYDSLEAKYQASVLATDRLQTRSNQLDSALKKRERELADIRTTLKITDLHTGQFAPVSSAKLQEELKKEKTVNNTLLELGSVLHASNLRILPIHVSATGRRVRITRKAKKTNDLRIIFDIDRNYVAGTGEKMLYLVITDPKGKLQKVGDWASGTTQTFDGKAIDYTLQKKVLMKENEPLKNVEINCKLEQINGKGKFRFALYQNGYMIGDKSLSLE